MPIVYANSFLFAFYLFDYRMCYFVDSLYYFNPCLKPYKSNDIIKINIRMSILLNRLNQFAKLLNCN